MRRHYRYIALLDRDRPIDDPLMVVRVHDGHEEVFTPTYGWTRCDPLCRTWFVNVAITEDHALRLIPGLAPTGPLEERDPHRPEAVMAAHEGFGPEWHYYAIEDEEHPFDDPVTVVGKKVSAKTEVSFTRNLVWEPGPVSGRRVRITPEDADRFEEVQARRVFGDGPRPSIFDWHGTLGVIEEDRLVPVDSVPSSEYEYWAITNLFYPDVTAPAAVVRAWLYLPGIPVEELFSRALDWEHTTIVRDVKRLWRAGKAVRVTEEGARGFAAIQAERARTAPDEPRYRYFALLNEHHPTVDDPAVIGRKWDDGRGEVCEEVYTDSCAWAGNTGSWHQKECVEIDEAAARRHEEKTIERYSLRLPENAQFAYFAIVPVHDHDVEGAQGLVRTWNSPRGSAVEEDFYTGPPHWRRGSTLDDISRGYKSDDDVRISEETAQRLQDKLIQRAAEWRKKSAGTFAYYAITSGGRTVDDPLNVVRVFTPEEGEPVEEKYDDFGWAATDLRHTVTEDEAVPITESRFKRFSILRYQRKRSRQAPN